MAALKSAALLASASAAAAAAPAVIWARGAFSSLSVGPDFSMALRVGAAEDTNALAFTAAPPAPAPASFALASGNDAGWGAFDELRLLDAGGGLLYAVRYHAAADVFTFERPADAAVAPWPWFALPATANASAVGAWSFVSSYMLPGSFWPSLDACAASAVAGAGTPSQVTPPALPALPPQANPACNLTGNWCCEPTVVLQDAQGGLTTKAAYGTGVGRTDGLVAQVNFSNVGPQTGAISADCATIQWSPVGSTWARSGPATAAHSDGPLFVFSRGATRPRAALAFAPLSNFSAQDAACGAGGPGAGSAFGALTIAPGVAPPGTRLAAALVARPGLKRATVALGALLRQRFGTRRLRGVGTRALSYWSDNAAGYSFWSEAKNLARWGQPEALF